MPRKCRIQKSLSLPSCSSQDSPARTPHCKTEIKTKTMLSKCLARHCLGVICLSCGLVAQTPQTDEVSQALAILVVQVAGKNSVSVFFMVFLPSFIARLQVNSIRKACFCLDHRVLIILETSLSPQSARPRLRDI